MTSGASAALTLAAAVCVAGNEPRRLEDLPASARGRRVVVQRAHRDPYDHAITAVGVQLTEIGFPTSTYPDELARELDDSAVAVLWRPGVAGELLPLATVARTAHERGVPVIVDAAMSVPPLARLHRMFTDGADLIAISGGKGLRGPHTAGLLCGRPDLVDAVHCTSKSWTSGSSLATVRVTGASPLRGRHGLGRGMKVGREQIAGLLTALREFVAEPDRWRAHYGTEFTACAAELSACPDLVVRDDYNDHLDVPVLTVDFAAAGLDANEVVRGLDTGEPRIHIGEDGAWRNELTINPMGLHAGEGATVGRRIVDVLSRANGST